MPWLWMGTSSQCVTNNDIAHTAFQQVDKEMTTNLKAVLDQVPRFFAMPWLCHACFYEEAFTLAVRFGIHVSQTVDSWLTPSLPSSLCLNGTLSESPSLANLSQLAAFLIYHTIPSYSAFYLFLSNHSFLAHSVPPHKCNLHKRQSRIFAYSFTVIALIPRTGAGS